MGAAKQAQHFARLPELITSARQAEHESCVRGCETWNSDGAGVGERCKFEEARHGAHFSRRLMAGGRGE